MIAPNIVVVHCQVDVAKDAVYVVVDIDMHAVYFLVGTAVDTVYVVYKDVDAVYCPVDRAIDAVYKLVVVNTGAVYKMSSMPCLGCTGAAYYRLQLKAVLHVAQTPEALQLMLMHCIDMQISSCLCRQSFAYFFGHHMYLPSSCQG